MCKLCKSEIPIPSMCLTGMNVPSTHRRMFPAVSLWTMKSLKQPKCQPNRKLSTSIVGYLMNMQLWRMSRRYIQQRTLIEKCSPSISCLVQMPVQPIDEDGDLNMGNPVRYWGAWAMAKLDYSGCQLWGYTHHSTHNNRHCETWQCSRHQQQNWPYALNVCSRTGTTNLCKFSRWCKFLYWYRFLGFHSPTRESLYWELFIAQQALQGTHARQGCWESQRDRWFRKPACPHIPSRGANEAQQVFINDCFLAYIASGMHFNSSSARLITIFPILSHPADGK